MAILSDVTKAMKSSPLVALDRLTGTLGLDGRILCKLDYLLPGGSKKDRAALRIIRDAEASGELSPGQTVVELTSGNMGTGLAIVCGVLGYPFVAVMSEGNSTERAKMMRALGAEVVLVPQSAQGRDGNVSGADLGLVEAEAQRQTRERGAFRADQFQRQGNAASHFDGTGPEIWEQSDGAVTAFVDFVGSGGTLAGCSRFLSAKGVSCFAVEPVGAEAISSGSRRKPEHPIQGGGYDMPDLHLLESASFMGVLKVDGIAARSMARKLAIEEGIFAGYSTGANLAAAIQVLRGPMPGACVAMIACDSGMKYLSTDLWGDDVHA